MTVTGKFMLIERAEESSEDAPKKSAEESSKDNPKTLAEISAFLNEKTIKCYCGEVESIKKQGTGIFSFLQKMQNRLRISKNWKILAKKKKVSEHPTLNKCCMVVVCCDVIGDDEKTIAENLAPQGVTKVRSIMRKVNGKLVNTAALELMLDSPNKPASIKIAYSFRTHCTCHHHQKQVKRS